MVLKTCAFSSYLRHTLACHYGQYDLRLYTPSTRQPVSSIAMPTVYPVLMYVYVAPLWHGSVLTTGTQPGNPRTQPTSSSPASGGLWWNTCPLRRDVSYRQSQITTVRRRLPPPPPPDRRNINIRFARSLDGVHTSDVGRLCLCRHTASIQSSSSLALCVGSIGAETGGHVYPIIWLGTT